MTPAELFDTHQERFIAVRTIRGGCQKFGHSQISAEKAIVDSVLIVGDKHFPTESVAVWERTPQTRKHEGVLFQVYRRVL
jgi:hypothetical protein